MQLKKIKTGRASLVAQTVKNLPAMRETQLWSLVLEDPLEKETAAHSSILAWRIPQTEEPGGLQSVGSQRVGHTWSNWAFFGIAFLWDWNEARLQQYVNREFPDVRAGFRKDRGTRDQIASICWIIEKEREFQKNVYFCFIDYANDFACVDHNKQRKILKEIGIPDHLTCLLWNLYMGQDSIARTVHGTMDWFQIGKGVYQDYILSPCLFNLYVEYIMQNPRLRWITR